MSENNDKSAEQNDKAAPNSKAGADKDQAAQNPQPDTPQNSGTIETSKEKGARRLFVRLSLITVEVFAVIFLLLAIASAGLVWRLQSGPMDVSFAKSYIEQALHDEAAGLDLRMDDIVLYWPDLKGPLLLGLTNARLLDENAREIFSVDEIAIGLSKRWLLIGQVSPKVLLIKKPAVRVVRHADGSFDFGLGKSFASAQEAAQGEDRASNIVEEIMEVIAHPGTESDKSRPIARLERFQIQQAQLYYQDEAAGSALDLPSVNIDIQSTREGMMAGMEIALDPSSTIKEQSAEEERFYPLIVQMFLNWQTKHSKLQVVLDGVDFDMLAEKLPQIRQDQMTGMELNGTAVATLDANFIPVQAALDLSIPQGEIQHDDLSAEAVPVRDVSLKALYEGNKVLIEDISATLHDVVIHASAELDLERAGAGADLADGAVGKGETAIMGVRGPMRLWIEDMPQSYIEPLWPKVLEEENAKKWVVDRLTAGDLSGLLMTMDIEAEKNKQVAFEDAQENENAVEDPAQALESAQENQDVQGAEAVGQVLDRAVVQQEQAGWDFDVQNLRAEFAFENMQVNYRDPLPPVENAKGNGVFILDEEKLRITVEEGELGGMQVMGAELAFYNILEGGKGIADLKIPLKGPLAKAFAYISTEPIDLKDELDMDLSQVKGDAELTVKLEFPAIADLMIDQVKIDVKGRADNVFLPDILQGQPVTGGPFTFEVNNERYVVQGSGNFAGRPVTAEWQEYLDSEGKPFKNRAKVSITADEGLRDTFGMDLSDFVEGPVPLDLTYTGYRTGGAIVSGRGNLRDAVLKVEPLKYRKEAGANGDLSFKLEMRGDTPKELSALNVTAPGLQVEGGRLVFAQSGAGETYVKTTHIDRMVVGETVGKLDIETESNGRMKIVLNGPFLDLRPFLEEDEDKDQKQYDSPPVLISVAADQMRTSDEEIVQYGKLYADIDARGRFNQLEMDAVAGGGDIYLRYKPDTQTGARTFRFEADNAGAALRAFGVYKQIRGGKIVIYAEPIDNIYDRNLVGVAEISDFRAVNAPVLARLLGAMSLPGMIQLLDGEGVNFSKLEAQFDWLYRPQGGLLVLKDGRTSGNALGLTFDGVFDNTKQSLDVSGTIIPLSGINNAVSSIPILGDILSGGSSAVFAATYTVQGPTEDPDVDVNPLAALAPGILRRILFE